jgi:1-acyl-sn-glycerol-3-phosphate acyltransferase
VALVTGLLLCVIRLGVLRLGGPFTPMRRALWLQWSSRLLLRSMGVRCHVRGTPPTQGLVVSNHLSYVDVLIYGAAAPSVFLSKAEVSKWPFFGWVTRCAGTLYVDRSSLASAEAVSLEIAGRLHHPIPVVIFPEGTSTDGTSVLRFHSRLFEPVVAAGVPITAAAIRFTSGDGTPESELCWFGDEDFLANLWKVFGVPGWQVEVRFGEPRLYPDRRTAADVTHDEIAAMRLNGVADLAMLSTC